MSVYVGQTPSGDGKPRRLMEVLSRALLLPARHLPVSTIPPMSASNLPPPIPAFSTLFCPSADQVALQRFHNTHGLGDAG